MIRPFYEERILNSAVDGWRPSKPHFRSDRGNSFMFYVWCVLCGVGADGGCGGWAVVLDKAWGLVEECWRYDPHARPNATRLVASLEDLLRQLPAKSR